MERDFDSQKARETRTEQFKKARFTLLEGLREIKSCAEDAEECAKTAARRNRQGRLGEQDKERVLKNLDTLNKKISESGVKEIAGFLFPETLGWEEEIAALYPDPLARHLEFSARFYQALSKAARDNLRALEA